MRDSRTIDLAGREGGANVEEADSLPVLLGVDPFDGGQVRGLDAGEDDVETVRYATFPVRDERSADTARAPDSLARRFLRDLGRGIAVVFVLHVFVVQISVVRGLSMEPCLHDGDRLIVDRLSYVVADVARNDVVVLRNPRNTAVDYVKRIIGLPGERVAIHDGVVYIDGDAVSDEPELVDDHAEMPEIVVPEDHFFVLGDNRPVSCDSREFGLVAGELLKGKVRMRFWPLERFGVF